MISFAGAAFTQGAARVIRLEQVVRLDVRAAARARAVVSGNEPGAEHIRYDTTSAVREGVS